MDLLEAVNNFISLLMICNPFGILPIFLKLTAKDTYQEKRKTSIKAAIAIASILVGAVWLGIPILNVLGIKVAPFQFIGALVILSLAFSMLKAEDSRLKQTSEEKLEATQKDSIAITPLAIPLVAGPGAISAIISTSSSFPGVTNLLILTLITIVISLIMGSILFFAGRVEVILGRVGLNIFTRIGGLVVAANSFDSLANALKEIFPILANR